MLRKNKLPKVSPHLNEASLVELKTSSFNFLKVDLAYLAAAGTVAGALKIDRREIYDVLGADAVVTFVHAFLIIAAIDLLVHFWIMGDVIAINQRWTRAPGRLLAMLSIHIQPLAHLIFVAVVISGPIAYSQGVNEARSEFHNYSIVQKAVENYLRTEKKVPLTIEDVENKFPELRQTRAAMPNVNITIRPDDKVKYELMFTSIGKDGHRSTHSLNGLISGADIEEATKERSFP